MTTIALRTLPAAIAGLLRSQILDGTLPAGQPLRQDALAAAHGVSRIPLREAFLQLEAEGLVRIVPHKGAVVAPLSLAEVRDVFDLRLLLEPRLLRASVPLLDDGDFAGLEATQAAFAEAIAAGDRAQWGVLNARLHGLMYGRADMPRSAAIVAGLLQTSERYTRMQLATPEAWQRANREHAELIRLCRARAVEDAAAVLHSHIDAVRNDVCRQLLPK